MWHTTYTKEHTRLHCTTERSDKPMAQHTFQNIKRRISVKNNSNINRDLSALYSSLYLWTHCLKEWGEELLSEHDIFFLRSPPKCLSWRQVRPKALYFLLFYFYSQPLSNPFWFCHVIIKCINTKTVQLDALSNNFILHLHSTL